MFSNCCSVVLSVGPPLVTIVFCFPSILDPDCEVVERHWTLPVHIGGCTPSETAQGARGQWVCGRLRTCQRINWSKGVWSVRRATWIQLSENWTDQAWGSSQQSRCNKDHMPFSGREEQLLVLKLWMLTSTTVWGYLHIGRKLANYQHWLFDVVCILQTIHSSESEVRMYVTLTLACFASFAFFRKRFTRVRGVHFPARYISLPHDQLLKVPHWGGTKSSTASAERGGLWCAERSRVVPWCRAQLTSDSFTFVVVTKQIEYGRTLRQSQLNIHSNSM